MRVRVAGLVVESEKLLVLVYSYPKGRVYAIPGGRIEPGEFAAQTLVREFREELGVEISVGNLRFVGEMQAQENIGQTLHLIFQVSILSGQPCLNSEETSAASFQWVDMDSISKVALYPDLSPAQWRECQSCGGAQYLGNVMQRGWA